MSIEAFNQHIYHLVEAIEDCAARRRILPCLTLIYSGVDVMASLDAEPSEGVKVRFVRWLDTYLLPDQRLGSCNAIDLYAARCGVVHTFTANSDLAQQQKARKIAYAWGLAKVDDLRRTSKELGYSEWLSIHVTDLISAFRRAIVRHLDEVEADASTKARFDKAAGIWFTSVDQTQISDFLTMVDLRSRLQIK